MNNNYCDYCKCIVVKDDLKLCITCKNIVGKCCGGLFYCQSPVCFCEICYDYKCVVCNNNYLEKKLYIEGIGYDYEPVCKNCKNIFNEPMCKICRINKWNDVECSDCNDYRNCDYCMYKCDKCNVVLCLNCKKIHRCILYEPPSKTSKKNAMKII